MAVLTMPPPGAATSNKASSTVDELKAALARAKGNLARGSAKSKQVTMALLLTAEMQATIFGWSFASGFMAKKGKSLKVMGIDSRPVVAALLAGGALFTDDAAVHLLTVANGTLGSFMAEWAFDLGVRAATPKAEREAAAAAKKEAAAAAASTTTSSGVPDDVPPAIRFHVAREPVGDVEVETGAGLRLTPQSNIHHWYKVWSREVAQYHKHKSEGHTKRAERSLGNAQNAKAKGMSIYNRAKANGKNVVLPAGWVPKKKKAPKAPQAQQERIRVIRVPQQQQQIDVDDSSWDYVDFGGGDDGADLMELQSPDQGDFFEYLEDLSDSELDAISGTDGGDNGVGDDEMGGVLDWPSDEFAEFEP